MINLNINLPKHFENERKYVLNTLFERFQNLQINFSINDSLNEVIINIDGKKSIIIKDFFWKDLDEDNYAVQYYQLPAIPKTINFQTKYFQTELTSLYGEPTIDEDNDRIVINSDIIGASFFLLTRLEELLNTCNKDDHGRFPDQECFLIKYNLHKRPLINEYINLLKYFIESTTETELKYKKNYSVSISHDVDEIFQLFPIKNFIKTLGADLIHRKSLSLAINTFVTLIKSIFNKKNDPFYTYQYLMNTSEKYGLQSEFYFIPSLKGEPDFRYNINDKAVIKIIENILERKHIFGIHPSYSTFKNPDQLKKEKRRLEEVSNHKVTCGRQHFLRFHNPETWQHWDNLGLEQDSSVGFIDHAGFKTGICYEHKVFDVINRKTLNLTNRPLTVMEVALKRVEITPEEFKNEILELAKITSSYNGDFMLLWHNNNLNNYYWKKIGTKYEEIIRGVKNVNN